MIRSDLTNYLKSKETLTHLVGQRIHWIRVPQRLKGETTYPCITFRRATGGYAQNLDGSQGFSEPLFEFDIWGPDSEVVEQVSEALRCVLQGFLGMMVATRITCVSLEDEQDFLEPPAIGDDTTVYRIQQKYTIGHAVAIPAFV